MINCPMPYNPELCNKCGTKNGVPMMNNTKKVMRAQLWPLLIMCMKNHVNPREKSATNIKDDGDANGDAICPSIDASTKLRKTPITKLK